MPTGYTADVQSGKVTEFREFAMSCARAFGALIEMRDEPADAPVPERFARSTYHDQALATAQARIVELEAMSEEQRMAGAMSDYRQAVEDWERREKERSQHAERYTRMLGKVLAWEPPSPDHEELKTFMRKQLEDSRKFDCSSYSSRPQPIHHDKWHSEQIAMAMRSVESHAAERVKETHRVESRNLWLQSLRASLELPNRQS